RPQFVGGNMRNWLGVALSLTAVVCALPASATTVTLVGGRVAKLKDKAGTSSDKAILKFVNEPDVSPPFPDPRCPASSSVRLQTDQPIVGPIALHCFDWQLTSSGFSYKDSDATAGGVQKVQLQSGPTGGKVLMKLKGPNYGNAAIDGPVDFLEAELDI